MFNFLFKSPLWQVIAISDWISKYIILLGLFILSIICTAIVIYKYLRFRKETQATQHVITQIKKAKTLSDLAFISKTFGYSTAGMLLAQSMQRLKSMIDNKNTQTTNSSMVKLSAPDIELLEASVNQEIDTMIMEEEYYLPILGTSSAVAPLIGLFGTIWGLIHSFISISQEKTADIATVAPGIAAALLTTLAGLTVAIPTMIAFHYFSNTLRKREALFLDISDTFLAIVKQSLS